MFFEKLPDEAILSLIYDIDIKHYQKGWVIYQEKSEVQNVYFLKSGDVEILKRIQIFEEDKS